MPTAARLVSAVLLAALAALVSIQVMQVMPESTDFGWFLQINIVLGIAVGWFWLGPNAGDGTVQAVSIGVTSAALLLFVGLFLQSWNEMMRLAMRNRYDGPFEAVAAIFVEGLTFGQYLTPEILGTLAAGGAIAGILASFAKRNWS